MRGQVIFSCLVRPSSNIFLGFVVAKATEIFFMASVWTIESLIYSATSMNLLCWLPRLPSPFTSMKFLPIVAVLCPGRSWVAKGGKVSFTTLAATQAIVFLACQLTSVRPQAAGRAAAPRHKFSKGSESKPVWPRSAWLSRREGGRGGAVVSRTPSRVLV